MPASAAGEETKSCSRCQIGPLVPLFLYMCASECAGWAQNFGVSSQSSLARYALWGCASECVCFSFQSAVPGWLSRSASLVCVTRRDKCLSRRKLRRRDKFAYAAPPRQKVKRMNAWGGVCTTFCSLTATFAQENTQGR